MDFLIYSKELSKIKTLKYYRVDENAFIQVLSFSTQLQTLNLKKFKGTEAPLVILASKYSIILSNLQK